MGTEPVAIGSAVIAFANALLGFVVLVGVWHAETDQLAAASTVIVTLVALVTAVLVRRRVTPVA